MAKYRVMNGTHWTGGKGSPLTPNRAGAVIELTEDEAATFPPGRLEPVIPTRGRPAIDPSDSVGVLLLKIKETDDPEELARLLKVEKTAKARKTVLEAIADRLAELDEPKDGNR